MQGSSIHIGFSCVTPVCRFVDISVYNICTRGTFRILYLNSDSYELLKIEGTVTEKRSFNVKKATKSFETALKMGLSVFMTSVSHNYDSLKKMTSG
jgi:hypothetical protein